MEAINLKGSFKYPNVVLDKQNGVFSISGKSLIEDARKFYDPLVEWLKNYSLKPNEVTKFEFNLEYINTASSVMILSIFLKLKALKNQGNNILITWNFNDLDMQEAGETYEEATGLKFEFTGEIDDEF